MTSLAIPLSLVPTFFVMKWLGFSLNNVTLLGLTLVVGVLVDDAIVEIENIVRRMRINPGGGACRAALEGSAEIGLAVVATSAAILAVFVPVAFMPGVPGQFFRQFGLTVSVAVAFSLVVARLLTPLLVRWLLRPDRGTTPRSRPVSSAAAILLCCVAACTTVSPPSRPAWPSSAHPSRWCRSFPATSCRAPIAAVQRVSLELAPGATLADTMAVAREATRMLKARPEVVSVLASIGTATGGADGAAMGNIAKAGRSADRQPDREPDAARGSRR